MPIASADTTSSSVLPANLTAGAASVSTSFRRGGGPETGADVGDDQAMGRRGLHLTIR